MAEGGCIGLEINLPVELWQVVVGFIDDMATLRSLSLTSHYLHEIAQPYLFTYVLVEPLPVDCTKGITAFAKFSQRIPRLSGMVRRLSLHEKDRVNSRLAGLDLDDLERILGSLPNLKDLSISTPLRWNAGPPPTRTPRSTPIVVDGRGAVTLDTLTVDVLQHCDRAHPCPALLIQRLLSLFREIKYLDLARFVGEHCDCSIKYPLVNIPPRMRRYHQHVAFMHPGTHPTIHAVGTPKSWRDLNFPIRFILQALSPLTSLTIARDSAKHVPFWSDFFRDLGSSLRQCEFQDVDLAWPQRWDCLAMSSCTSLETLIINGYIGKLSCPDQMTTPLLYTLTNLLNDFHHPTLETFIIKISITSSDEESPDNSTLGTDWRCLRQHLLPCTKLQRLEFHLNAVSPRGIALDTSLLQATVRAELEGWHRRGILEVKEL
ncbi:hypothetical protein EIP91_007430 [Steccherinum ochraceum]|uniref:F-box domain-containing protein n=1 Tax=Steccherinum ochraceum TaxID=92696 RepID=A0A4R0RLB6_9APHY|nr:hypothetical protein EIP91_007430 [Steccherinum ochraceum]